MDKKSSSSDSRFHIGTYDSAAWRKANPRDGGGPVVHNDPSKFDKCYNYPYTGMSNTKTEKGQSSRQK